VDDGDTTSSYSAKTSDVLVSSQLASIAVEYPVGLDVKVTLIPVQDGAAFATMPGIVTGVGEEYFVRQAGKILHIFSFRHFSGPDSAVKARVTVWNDSYLAPSAVKKMVQVTFHKGLKRPK
jgi:hypothetical protein